ncbi:MAG: penicillin-binding protein activator [marine bacterium B5-7]|nr:MAG: penicillin-binding protein activator [marine bacterium B5-7]
MKPWIALSCSALLLLACSKKKPVPTPDGLVTPDTVVVTPAPTLAQDTSMELQLAQSALDNERPGEVRHIIANLDTQQFSQAQQITAAELSAQAYIRLRNVHASLQQRMLLQTLLKDTTEQQDNARTIWQTLSNQSLAALQTMQKQSGDTSLQAWVELNIAVRTHRQQAYQLLTALKTWQQQYPKHPANQLLAKNLELPWQTPHHIALLLPVTGPLKQAGQAIRDGFLSQTYQLPADQRPTIDVLDTHDNNISALYQQAVTQNAQFVIGPLQKSALHDLLQQDDFPVPVLALNDSTDGLPTNVYGLALSPTQEAQQLTDKLRQKGIQRVVVIYPQGDWGDRVGGTILNAWQQDGEKVIAAWQFKPHANFNAMTAHLLLVDASQKRHAKLKKQLHLKNLGFVPRRRQDIQAIAMIASPKVARQILPYLRYYYAKDIPVYATSYAYSGRQHAGELRDLNGLHFCDIPWMVTKRYAKDRQQLQSIWPSVYDNFPRLFALGEDAYHLTVGDGLLQLRLMPELGIAAATGRLTLTDQSIHRTLTWARVRRGEIHA